MRAQPQLSRGLLDLVDVILVDIVRIIAVLFDTEDVRPGLAWDTLERVAGIELVTLEPILVLLRIVHGEVLLALGGCTARTSQRATLPTASADRRFNRCGCNEVGRRFDA